MVNWSSRSHRTTRVIVADVADFIITFDLVHGLSDKSSSTSIRGRKPASSLVWHVPFWRTHLWSFYRRLSGCEFVSCMQLPSSLSSYSLQLEYVPQFLANIGFFLVHDFNSSWIFSSPLFSSKRRVSLCSSTLPRVFVSSAILNVFY